MIDFIKGEIVEISPTFVVLEANQIGYFINISLNSFSELNGKTSCKLYIYESIREDAHVLFGFLHKSERELFLQLISVSGVGANTARMMLSSVSVADLQNAIANEDLMVLKNIKGIGAKTAQRFAYHQRLFDFERKSRYAYATQNVYFCSKSGSRVLYGEENYQIDLFPC